MAEPTPCQLGNHTWTPWTRSSPRQETRRCLVCGTPRVRDLNPRIGREGFLTFRDAFRRDYRGEGPLMPPESRAELPGDDGLLRAADLDPVTDWRIYDIHGRHLKGVIAWVDLIAGAVGVYKRTERGLPIGGISTVEMDFIVEHLPSRRRWDSRECRTSGFARHPDR